jgi:hypothetical protein
MTQVSGPLRAVEKILLNALLLRQEIRATVIPKLRQLPQVEQFSTARLFQAMFRLYDNKPDFRYPDLEARLEEAEKGVMSAAVFADEVREEDYTLEQATACLDRLEVESRESQKADLRRRVKDAERAGNLPEALRLAGELGNLAKRHD